MAIFTITSTDSAVSIFDNFYSTRLRVNATDWDVVYSFFLGNSNDKTEASTFASLLFRIAQEGNYNVLDLLATIKGKTNKLQMNQVICYYLNTFRPKASLYGVGIIPRPNEPVQRNVVM
jgi:uridylate kinase